MDNNHIDKYLAAVKTASDSLAEHGCAVSGLSIAASRVLDGIAVQDAKITLEIYVPAPEQQAKTDGPVSA